MEDKYKSIIELAALVVLHRGQDVNTEDGYFATTCSDQIIRLEAAISEAFELNSDDVNVSDLTMIMTKLEQLNKTTEWYDWNGVGDIPSGVSQVCFADGWAVDFMEFMKDPDSWKQEGKSTDIIAYTLNKTN